MGCTVLNYMKDNWPDNKTISGKELTFTLTILILLVTTLRPTGTHHLNLKHMGQLED